MDVAVDNEQWLDPLGATGRLHEDAVARLHATMLRFTRAELGRRSGDHALTGPELDDLAHQAAADAVIAIISKLDEFRGDSRFTTWAYRFAALEVSRTLGRHFWHRHPSTALEAEDWDRLPDRLAVQPDEHAQHVELVAAVRDAVQTELTDRQRSVFVAIAVNGVPLDALVARTGSSRNAIYKTMFDARRRLRAALVANGHLRGLAGAARAEPGTRGTRRPARSASAVAGWAQLDRLLQTDPADVGCDTAIEILHVYAELVRDADLAPTARAGVAQARHTGIAAHLAACGPCGDDFEGLLVAVQAEAQGGFPAEPDGR